MSHAQKAFSRALYRYDKWKCEWTVISLTFKSESRSKVQFTYLLQSQVFFINEKTPQTSKQNTTPQITDNSLAVCTLSNRPLFLFSFTYQHKSSKVLLLLDLHTHSEAYLAPEPTKTLRMKSTLILPLDLQSALEKMFNKQIFSFVCVPPQLAVTWIGLRWYVKEK